VNPRHNRYKLRLLLLIGGGAIACTCAALNVDFRQVVHGLLHAVGIRSSHAGGQHTAEIIVSAGNELTIVGGLQRITPISDAELARRLGWSGVYSTGGWLKFRGQSLEIVVGEFNRHNKRQLRVADPRTGRLAVGGSFRENDVDGFLAALAMTHGVEATPSPGDVIILTGGDASGSAEIPGAPQP
jgi:ferric-dicitrate binding protein FerR (iron transport regulator)